MPERERPAYHHGNLRAALLDAGLELTRTGGPDGLALRDVTRRAGVSASAAYRHFADRDDLLAAIATRIQDDMAARMRSFVDEETAPPACDRLRAVGLGYIAFALREPGWFETAFSTTDALPGSGEGMGEGTMPAPLSSLVAALDALVAEGTLAPAERPGAEWPCWSAVHGFALLALHGPLRRLPRDEVWSAAERTVDAIVDGLLARSASDGVITPR